MAAQPICNRKVGGFESPLGLQSETEAERPLTGDVRYVGATRDGQVRDVAGDSLQARVGEWLNPAVCKTAAVTATQVRILPRAPFQAPVAQW